jgi:hypothetical protein
VRGGDCGCGRYLENHVILSAFEDVKVERLISIECFTFQNAKSTSFCNPVARTGNLPTILLFFLLFLPKRFREKLYFQYRGKFGISGREYQQMLAESKDEATSGITKKQVAGAFDKRIAAETDLPQMVTKAINQTVKWPSTVQSLKGLLSAGPARSWRYLQEKREKGRMK